MKIIYGVLWDHGGNIIGEFKEYERIIEELQSSVNILQMKHAVSTERA